MGGGVEIRDNPLGWDRTIKRIGGLKGAVRVGVDSRPHEPTGQPTDEIGTWHEFGNGHIPERSFLRAWVNDNIPAINKAMHDAADACLDENGPADWRSAFGQWAVAEIRKRIWANIPPPLNPRTAKRKGTEIALIDSGQLVAAIIEELEAI